MTKHDMVAEITKPKTGRHLGDVVGWSMSGWANQEKVNDLLKECGLDTFITLPTVRANNAYRRAVQLSVRGGSVDTRDYSVVLLEDTADKIVHAVMSTNIEDIGAAGLSTNDAQVVTLFKVGFDKLAYRKASKPAADLLQIESAGVGHPISARIEETYTELAVVYRPDDIRAAFQRAFSIWGGCRMVGSGGVWWIPSSHSEKVRAWVEFMQKVYGANSSFVLPMFDTEETIKALREASENDMEARLEKLADELKEFASRDNVRISSFEHRLEEFGRLRDVVELHDDILGMRRDSLRAQLKDAEKSLGETISNITTKLDA